MKQFSKLMMVFFMVLLVMSCKKESDDILPASEIVGEWSVVAADVVVNSKKYAVPSENFKANYDNVSYNFMSNNKFIFTDIDAEQYSGKWAFDGKNVTITYEDDYINKFLVSSISSTEIILTSPEVNVDKINEESQDFETAFAATALLIGTEGESIVPKTISIALKLKKK
jgi:Lipocalin-like domain